MSGIANIDEFPDRVLRRIADAKRGAPDECWEWPCKSYLGYGIIDWGTGQTRRRVNAHRVSWIVFNGPIVDERLTVHHACYNRACWNPAHLRLVTRSFNSKDNAHRRKTHCPSGHPYDETNTYVTDLGHRLCRACRRKRNRLDGIRRRAQLKQGTLL